MASITLNSKPSNAPFFPGSVLDIDKQTIIPYLDPNSLIAMSSVNKRLNEYLDNGKFFKNLFLRLHPHLAKQDQTFQILCKNHPNNCWKVACTALFKGEFKPKKTFCSDLVNSLKMQKMHLEEKLKEICGYGYADPNSPIDQAWKAYEKDKQEFDATIKQSRNDLKELISPLLAVHSSEKELSMIIFLLVSDSTVKLFSDRTDEEIKSLPDVELGLFNRNLIPSYRLLCDFLQEAKKVAEKLKKLAKAYDELEGQRVRYSTELPQISQNLVDLKRSPETFIPAYTLKLSEEFKLESSREKILVNLSILEECLSLITECTQQGNIPSDGMMRIRNLINSLDYEEKTEIWQELYVQCAGGKDEDRWSEKHFTEFLPELLEIVKYVKSNFENCHGPKLQNINLQLNDLKFSPIIFEAPVFNDEAFGSLYTLEECLFAIDECLNHANALSDILRYLKYLINSLEHERGHIWAELYYKCSGGVDENQWSENHFAEFLPELREIIEQIKFNYEHKGRLF